MMKRIYVLLSMFVLSSIQAKTIEGDCSVHTWHDVSSNSGEWKISLKMINQSGRFYDRSCSDASETSINPQQKLAYGFQFDRDADFDIAYTLTAVKEEHGFQSKACVFVISANGPAQPDIHALSYHGAECEWKVIKGVGENFSVG